MVVSFMAIMIHRPVLLVSLVLVILPIFISIHLLVPLARAIVLVLTIVVLGRTTITMASFTVTSTKVVVEELGLLAPFPRTCRALC